MSDIENEDKFLVKYKNVKKISAYGTRGSAKGILFTAKKNRQGQFVLNRKVKTPSKGNTTNMAKNKVCVNSLTEAANLLATNEYLINLVSPEGKRALREHNKVCVDF